MRLKYLLILIVVGWVLLFKGGEIMALELKSPAFENNDFIPDKYTCRGENISPPLNWSGVPEGTKSFALICDDPDAPRGDWVHWIIYDIPAETSNLSEGIKSQKILPDGSKQGMTDFRETGYGGPCAPPGPPHRYLFKLYALDAVLNFKTALTKSELLKAIEKHIIEQTKLIGKFQR